MSYRILYLGRPEYGNLEWSFERAFRALGCEVTAVDTTEAAFLSRLREGSLPYRIAAKLSRPLLPAAFALSLARGPHARQRYDLVFCHKTLLVPPRAVRALADRAGARLYCFYPDHPFDDHPSRANARTRGLIPLTDGYFTFGGFMVEPLRRAGARRIEVLPFAYDPELHHPPILSDEERARLRCQVAFIGNFSDERAGWLRHLVDLDLGVWGHRWSEAERIAPGFARARRGGPLFGPRFAEIYAAADIGLNLIQVYGDGHNMRSFEAMACGGFVMSNRTRELVRLFKEDEEIVCFDSPGELREKVDHYLRRPEERARIARAGFERVRDETYERRVRAILQLLEAQRKSGAGGMLA